MISVLPLGCYGSELEEKKMITFRLTESTLIDAGGILSAMPKSELLKIKNIIITHSHYDHIKDMPSLADFMLSYGFYTFNIYTTERIAAEIQKHIFNDLIWPDFTKLGKKGHPTINFKFIEFGKVFHIDDLEFLPIEVNHVVESIGFIIRKNNISLGYSGDTYICDNLVETLNREKNLSSLFYETSFPNRLDIIAKSSKHLTPSLLELELARIKADVPVHLFHLKSHLVDEIKSEVEAIKTNKQINYLRQKCPVNIGS